MRVRKFNESLSDLDFRSKFKKKITYHCQAGAFDGIVNKAYGHVINIEAEEQYMYEASVNYSAESDPLDGYDRKDFDKFLSTGKYPGTNILLNALCVDGYIDEGDYYIHSDA